MSQSAQNVSNIQPQMHPMQTPMQMQMPMPMIGDPFFQLRRDWEHAFHVQSLHGRGTEHLQQLMHSQFTFLEHVVLDVSKQCHALQDQLSQERGANQKLAAQVEEFQKQFSIMKQPILDLENKFVKLDANQAVLLQQQKGLDSILNTHGAALKSKITEKSAVERDVLSKMTSDMDKIRSEMAELKSLVDQEKEQRVSEKVMLDAAIEETRKQIDSLRADIVKGQVEVLREARQSIDQTSLGIERNFSSLKHSHQTEQQTILSVIKTMTSNITTIRKEIHRLETRNQAKMEELKDAILAQFKQEVKTVTRPLIVY